MEIKADNSYISSMKKLMVVITVRNSFYLTTVLRVSENAEYLKTVELLTPYCKILLYLISQLIRIICVHI